MKKQITFPTDFVKTEHPNGGFLWMYQDRISIIGGGRNQHGNGETTFEYWDFDKDKPEGYLSIEEINDRLKEI